MFVIASCKQIDTLKSMSYFMLMHIIVLLVAMLTVHFMVCFILMAMFIVVLYFEKEAGRPLKKTH